jgi:hypothetical protein
MQELIPATIPKSGEKRVKKTGETRVGKDAPVCPAEQSSAAVGSQAGCGKLGCALAFGGAALRCHGNSTIPCALTLVRAMLVVVLLNIAHARQFGVYDLLRFFLGGAAENCRRYQPFALLGRKPVNRM